MASSSCFRVENVFSHTISKFKHSNVNGNGNATIISPPISSFSLLSSSHTFSPKFPLLKTSLSHSLSIKASSSTAIAEPEGIKVLSPPSLCTCLCLLSLFVCIIAFVNLILMFCRLIQWQRSRSRGRRQGLVGFERRYRLLSTVSSFYLFSARHCESICLFVARRDK